MLYLGQVLETGHSFWPAKYKGLTFYPTRKNVSPPMGNIPMRKPCPHLWGTSSVEKTSVPTGGPHKAGILGTQYPLMPDAHTNASQLHNSSQRTLRSSHLAQGRAPSNMAHMTTRLKAVAKLLIPILQLFKQIKCSHELDNQELPYKGENC